MDNLDGVVTIIAVVDENVEMCRVPQHHPQLRGRLCEFRKGSLARIVVPPFADVIRAKVFNDIVKGVVILCALVPFGWTCGVFAEVVDSSFRVSCLGVLKEQ